MVHNRVVQWLISKFLPYLDHTRDLVCFAFTYQVGDSGGKHEDLERGDPALLVDPLEEILCDNALQRLGQSGPHLVLLFRRKDVDHAVHGFGRAGSMQRAEHQMSGAGCHERQFNCLEVAQLTNQNDVRILAQSSAKAEANDLV